MKNFFKLLSNQVLIEISFYILFVLGIYFIQVESIPLDMLSWPIESKILYMVFSALGFLFNIISIYDNDNDKLIKCKCPYCEKDFKIDLNEHKDKEKDSKENSTNNNLLYSGIIAGAILMS